ncbi:uncharacterized protein LOC116603539 isoform X2 [Nematostella vectensis]|uniref:uncharacterized protein LOC116603539 isoform X2 n=1 Tax=Nematostella vectensis TaxID=45351 RepID=UPI002076E19C|nr:uncharacterized protein LOC116603539 isoform X2 [Nematostella vectensis]
MIGEKRRYNMRICVTYSAWVSATIKVTSLRCLSLISNGADASVSNLTARTPHHHPRVKDKKRFSLFLSSETSKKEEFRKKIDNEKMLQLKLRSEVLGFVRRAIETKEKRSMKITDEGDGDQNIHTENDTQKNESLTRAKDPALKASSMPYEASVCSNGKHGFPDVIKYLKDSSSGFSQVKVISARSFRQENDELQIRDKKACAKTSSFKNSIIKAWPRNTSLAASSRSVNDFSTESNNTNPVAMFTSNVNNYRSYSVKSSNSMRSQHETLNKSAATNANQNCQRFNSSHRMSDGSNKIEQKTKNKRGRRISVDLGQLQCFSKNSTYRGGDSEGHSRSMRKQGGMKDDVTPDDHVVRPRRSRKVSCGNTNEKNLTTIDTSSSATEKCRTKEELMTRFGRLSFVPRKVSFKGIHPVDDHNLRDDVDDRTYGCHGESKYDDSESVKYLPDSSDHDDNHDVGCLDDGISFEEITLEDQTKSNKARRVWIALASEVVRTTQAHSNPPEITAQSIDEQYEQLTRHQGTGQREVTEPIRKSSTWQNAFKTVKTVNDFVTLMQQALRQERTQQERLCGEVCSETSMTEIFKELIGCRYLRMPEYLDLYKKRQHGCIQQ